MEKACANSQALLQQSQLAFEKQPSEAKTEAERIALMSGMNQALANLVQACEVAMKSAIVRCLPTEVDRTKLLKKLGHDRVKILKKMEQVNLACPIEVVQPEC